MLEKAYEDLMKEKVQIQKKSSRYRTRIKQLKAQRAEIEAEMSVEGISSDQSYDYEMDLRPVARL